RRNLAGGAAEHYESAAWRGEEVPVDLDAECGGEQGACDMEEKLCEMRSAECGMRSERQRGGSADKRSGTVHERCGKCSRCGWGHPRSGTGGEGHEIEVVVSSGGYS